VSAGPTAAGGTLAGTLHAVLRASARAPGAIGFALNASDDASRQDSSRDDATPDEGEQQLAVIPIRRTPAGDVAAGDLTGRVPIAVVPAPVTDRRVVTQFADAFDANRKALTIEATSIIPSPKPLDLSSTKAALVAATDPSPVGAARARLAVQVSGRALLDGLVGLQVHQREPLDPIMVGPLLPEPLYRSLAAADPDRFLPGVGDIPDDTVTMLETNPRFVEAFLVGANHEMNRELLWRRYPTDRRGTPFHRFWDRTDGAEDIGPIHAFRPDVPLGAHSGADLRGSLVLLVRGQLLRRYPNAVISAAPSRPDGSLDLASGSVRHPVFWGRIDPDVTFVGFDLAREDVEAPPGWYFVIAEQPTEPRFGLDVPPEAGATGSPATWSDLDWGHVGVAPGGHLRLAATSLVNQDKPIVAGGSARARFGRTSADMAAITFQRPFRAAIHSSEIIAGAAPSQGVPLRPVLAHAVLLRPIALQPIAVEPIARPGGG
jgi:hypothetical protein